MSNERKRFKSVKKENQCIENGLVHILILFTSLKHKE